MSTFSLLNNVAAISAENQLNVTQNALSNTLQQLSTGSRLNTGAEDPAGLAIANGLQGNIAALNQSQANTATGVGLLQVADGALSQVTNLLNTAVSLATEAANGGLSASQLTALDNQYSSIKNEITNIGANTTFNGANVFAAGTTSIFLSDGHSSYDIAVTIGTLSDAAIAGGQGSGLSNVDLSGTSLSSNANAATALTDIGNAITNVASNRGALGSTVDQLQAASNVIGAQVSNLTSAVNTISSANIPQQVSNLSQYNILTQTGIAALSQANSAQQAILRLFQ